MNHNHFVKKLSEKCETVDNAKRIAKEFYGGTCVVSCESKPDGAHIFGAGAFPQLKKYPANIVPVSRYHHSFRGNKNCMDFDGKRDRSAHEKINWLKSMVIDPYAKALLRLQLIILHTVLEQENIIYDFAQELLEYE